VNLEEMGYGDGKWMLLDRVISVVAFGLAVLNIEILLPLP
jgi:hypothetical protein